MTVLHVVAGPKTACGLTATSANNYGVLWGGWRRKIGKNWRVCQRCARCYVWPEEAR